MFKNGSKMLSFFLFIPLLVLACTDEPSKNDKKTEPTAPTQAGKAFLGWYKNKDFTNIDNRVDFANQPAGTFAMYPKFVDATDYTMGANGVLALVPDANIVEIPYNVDEVAVQTLSRTGTATSILENGGAYSVAKRIIFPSKGSLTTIGANAF